ncbi:MAG: PDZ domain-containing protein [Candidatus Doudnabacteria bacterium]|nr:PDZ domain-containing protein [Candidatus Doudnabacteria bacterium]
MNNKKQIVLIIVLCVIFSWAFDALAGRYLMAKISTLPVLNRLKLLSPQAPIVINNRETVRVSDSGDILQAAGQIKSKISTVVLISSSVAQPVGAAVNLTSDGRFVSASSAFSKPGNYFVLLNDGRSAQITEQTKDPATGLTFFKASLDSVPTASFGSSQDLKPGEKIFFAQNSVQSFLDKISITSVSFAQADIQGKIFEADAPRRSFGVDNASGAIGGEPVVNTNGEVVAVWNGEGLISIDVLKQALNLYLSNNAKISRAEFGFNYQIITKNESGLLGSSEGAQVKEVDASSPARLAGLLVGDVIKTINNKNISESSPLEEVLEQVKPGDKVLLSVARGKQMLALTLTAGEQK